ncbi:MAG: ATP-dependent DNA helicase RecG [Ignavibacteria bacterium]|nr:ATP-dependent DNA helicase RecG [Ignavibacteria bacterium]
MDRLSQPVSTLPLIGPARAKAFKSAGLNTVRDILFYFPFRHIDRTTILTIGKAYEHVKKGYTGEITLIGKVQESKVMHFGNKKVLAVRVIDNTAELDCIWFQGIEYFAKTFQTGQTLAISGKPSLSKRGDFQIMHPAFDKLTNEESENFFNTGKIIPVYSVNQFFKEANLGETGIRKIIEGALNRFLPVVHETLPKYILEKLELLPLQATIKALHLPESMEIISKAHHRLKFEEFFYYQLNAFSKKERYKKESNGIEFKPKTSLIKDFLNSLPFSLTKAQLKVLHEIKLDMLSPQPMMRLLQGDVGSGKTVVSLISMLIAVDSGYQAALMVPTEVLASQHFKSISKLLSNIESSKSATSPVIEILTGSTKVKEKKRILEALAGGEIDIIVGTHALFEENIEFKNLGFLVIDEQHRFGVEQRARLMRKSATPDVLVMTATPIPRTLSLTVFGELDVSIIDELPANRIPVRTAIRGESALSGIYDFIRSQVREGRQAFIVFPLVEESEKLDLKAAEQGFTEICTNWLPDLKIVLLHGRMKWNEKEEIMNRFAAGEYDVLVSTTIIEVGVDIPNATVMVINEAHRFGLSQLHQLRGRIGRGASQSYCILVTKDEIVASAARIKQKAEYLPQAVMDRLRSITRLKAMEESSDGFKLSEIDLKMRGPGDIFGKKQSGIPEFKYCDLANDSVIMLKAKDLAQNIIQNDPDLKQVEHQIIAETLEAQIASGENFYGVG